MGGMAPPEPSRCPTLTSGRGASGRFCAPTDGDPRSLLVADGSSKAGVGLPLLLGRVG